MPSRFDEILADDFDRRFDDFKEEIIRRPHGNETYWEPVMAVVQLDTGAAGAQISGGGLQEQQDRNQTERSGLVEVAASQEIFPDDKFVIDGELWSVTGKPVGSDAGSKTLVITRTDRHRGRQPNVNTRA